MKDLIDILNHLTDEDYARRNRCEAIKDEMKRLDEEAECLRQQSEQLIAERNLLLRERAVLYESIQGFKKQFIAEGF